MNGLEAGDKICDSSRKFSAMFICARISVLPFHDRARIELSRAGSKSCLTLAGLCL